MKTRFGFNKTWLSSIFTLAVLLLVAESAMAAAPVLVSAASRKTHTISGVPTALDVPLKLDASGHTAIESRYSGGANGLIIVLTFDQPVVSAASARSITSSTGAAGMSVAAPVFTVGSSSVTLTLSSLTDQHTYTVNLTNIAAADGSGTLPSASTSFRTLLGDVLAAGSVTSGDILTVRGADLQPLTYANFRSDLNISGTLTGSDVLTARARAGKVVAGGNWADTAPSFTAVIPTQNLTSGVTSAPIGFGLADTESQPYMLYVKVVSTNTTLIPLSAVTLTGTGSSRTMTITPEPGQVGTSNITLIVYDGILAGTTTFTVNVTSLSTLYVAQLAPQSGVVSTGTGTATLQVAGDGTQAILRFQYSNLSSPKVSEHVHFGAPGVSGPIIYDIDPPSAPSPPTQQADGSYLWIFDPAGSPTPAQIVSQIAAGNYYINIHTSNFTGGEIRGQFNYAAGSQTFSPPVAPPTQPLALPTLNDMSRFLQQATFGPSLKDINDLSAVVTANSLSNGSTNSYDAWLNAQFLLPTTSVYGDPANVNHPRWTYKGRVKYELNGFSTDRFTEAWWHNASTAPDQLRQRVAYALSQTLVISSADDTLDAWSPGMATYHDLLADSAFGNFRTLLNDVTLNPMMGQFLNMRGNNKQTLPAKPNENYAREIKQLFTIGVNILQPDGTLKLDAIGLPIPSYDQSVIEGFAQVFTGWNINGTVGAIDQFPQLTNNSGTTSVLQNYNNIYHQPMIPTASNHSIYQKDLLSYTGDYSASSPDRLVISATGGATTASCNAELAQALDNIFGHPNVGPFISRQLIQRLIGGTPSPAYVYRVAQIFNNDGSGIRGNLKAVVKAILTDREARAPQSDLHPYTTNPGYGHLREPVLRISHGIRAFHPNSGSSLYKMGQTDSLFFQTPYRSTTVFNFYYPDYSDPGVVSAARLFSPELQIANENSNVNYINAVYAGVYNTSVSTNGQSYGSNWPGSDLITRLDTMEGFDVVNTTTTSGSNQATVANTAGLAVGEFVIGNGIPSGTTISSIDTPATLTVYMSTNANLTVANNTLTVGAQAIVANTTLNNSTFTVPGTTTGLALGQTITAPTGIPAGMTIVQITPSFATTITLSANATASNSNAAFTYGSQVKLVNTTLSGSTVTTPNSAGLAVGQVVLLSGNAPLTYITAINTSVSPHVVTLSSSNTSASTANVTMQYSAFASEMQLASLADVAAAPTGVPAGANQMCQFGLLDRLNLQLMGGQMSASMKARIATYTNSLAAGTNTVYTNNLARARAAVHLVLSSANYATQK